jgi:hypothetical protein
MPTFSRACLLVWMPGEWPIGIGEFAEILFALTGNAMPST